MSMSQEWIAAVTAKENAEKAMHVAQDAAQGIEQAMHWAQKASREAESYHEHAMERVKDLEKVLGEYVPEREPTT